MQKIHRNSFDSVPTWSSGQKSWKSVGGHFFRENPTNTYILPKIYYSAKVYGAKKYYLAYTWHKSEEIPGKLKPLIDHFRGEIKFFSLKWRRVREGISNHTFNDLEQDRRANLPTANIQSDFVKLYYKYHNDQFPCLLYQHFNVFSS